MPHKRLPLHRSRLFADSSVECFLLFFVCLFVSFLATLWHREFPGQGSDSSHSCNLSYICSNARSLTHCALLGMEPAFQRSQDTTHPVAPQQELLRCGDFALRGTHSQKKKKKKITDFYSWPGPQSLGKLASSHVKVGNPTSH